MRQLLTRYVLAIALLALPSAAHAAVIGHFQWVNCSATEPGPPIEFEFSECVFGVNTLFRITNLSSDLAGQPGFPADGSSFNEVRVLFDGIDSGTATEPVPAGSGLTFFGVDAPAGAIVSLALALDPAWVGTLTLPALTLANTGPAPIEFVPATTSVPVPEPSSLLLTVVGIAAFRRRRPSTS